MRYHPPKFEHTTNNNVSLPPKIRCAICSRYQNQTLFSNNQLNIARGQLRSGRPSVQGITCKMCTSSTNRTEWTCAACSVCKGIDQFSKSQRKEGDNAICCKCMQDHANFNEPIDIKNSLEHPQRPKQAWNDHPSMISSTAASGNSSTIRRAAIPSLNSYSGPVTSTAVDQFRQEEEDHRFYESDEESDGGIKITEHFGEAPRPSRSRQPPASSSSSSQARS